MAACLGRNHPTAKLLRELAVDIDPRNAEIEYLCRLECRRHVGG